MPAIEQQIADHLSSLVQNAMSAKSMRFREDWEPQVVRTLGAAAEQCLSHLNDVLPRLRALPRHAQNTARLQMILGREFAPLVAQATEAAKDILRRMVRAESAAYGEALSLGGLAGAAPEIAGPDSGHDQLWDRLACGRELDQAVSASFVEFTERLTAALVGGTNEPDPLERLGLICAAWHASLERIARTILHQSATRLRQAVGAALS